MIIGLKVVRNLQKLIMMWNHYLKKKKKKNNLKIHDIDLKVTSIVNIRKISIPYISQFVKRVKVIVEKHSEISKVLLLKCFSKKIRQLGKVYKKLFWRNRILWWD